MYPNLSKYTKHQDRLSALGILNFEIFISLDQELHDQSSIFSSSTGLVVYENDIRSFHGFRKKFLHFENSQTSCF